MVLSNDLKLAVLQNALEGKITVQSSKDTAVEDTLLELETIREKLIKNKIIKGPKISEEDEEKPFTIPENWAWVRLTDIGELSRGKSKHRPRNDTILYIDGTIPLIQTGDVAAANKYIEKYNACYNETGLAQSRLWKAGTLCITIAANIGDVAILTFDACFPDSVLGFTPFSESVDVEYVYYMLLAYKHRMNQKASKVAQSNLSLDKISTMWFPFPPKEEQKRIVSILNEAIKRIEEYGEMEAQLEKIEDEFPATMKASILQAAMEGKLTKRLSTDSDPHEIVQYMSEYHGKKIKLSDSDGVFSCPENWCVVRLNEAANLYTGNSIPENVKAQKYFGLKEGYNYIGTKDVGFDHSIEYENGVKIPFEEPGFRYAEKDATLLCIEGGSAGKKIAILEEKVCFGNKLCAFHPIGIDRRFLYYYLQSPIFYSTFKDSISGIIGGVSIGKINKLLFPVPSIEEQKRIVARLEELLPLCDNLD